MAETKQIELDLSFSRLRILVRTVGSDLLVLVEGGETPHLGCTVLSVPRESLSGDGSRSCTSSVINVTGHRDDEICRRLAEKFCKATGKTVVCTGGFHQDGITQTQIEEIMLAVKTLEV